MSRNRKQLKLEALRLRKLGNSYSIINEIIRVPKGTLSYWLRNTPYIPNKISLERIKKAYEKSANTLHSRKIAAIKRARGVAFKEIGVISMRDLWMFGLGLYLGEGTKNKTHMVRITNSDPKVIKLCIAWFKKSCGLTNSNFRLCIHTYPDLDIRKTLHYWSKTTGIPINQFRKTHVDTRTGKSRAKYGKLPYGTAHLAIHSNGDKRNGVFLFHRIIGWISAIEKQI